MPIGHVDGIGAEGTILGWARDPDFGGAIGVHVYIQYNGAGSLYFLTAATANLPAEPAVGGNHRFSIPFVGLGATNRLFVLAINVTSTGALDEPGGHPLLNPGGLVTTNSVPAANRTGVHVMAYDAECPNQPVMVDVFVLEDSQWRWHGRGYTNVPVANPAPPAPPAPPVFPMVVTPANYGVYVPFKYPVPTSYQGGDPQSGGRFIVRTTRRVNCDQFHALWDPGNYQDHYPVAISTDPEFRGDGRSVVLPPVGASGWNYRLSMDRHGGAIYEFYNLRMGDPSLPATLHENAIHAHFGAALQLAMHAGDTHPEACGGQGWWNPTQAGGACAVPAGDMSQWPNPNDATNGFTVSCAATANGVLSPNNACTTAYKASLSEHRMINFDYAPTYQGPYNNDDQAMLSQIVDANHPDFVKVDITLRQATSEALTGALEIPTFYFSNRFRKFYGPEPSGSGVRTMPLPALPSPRDVNPKVIFVNAADECYDPGWVTAENTFATGASHPHITVAWFYKSGTLPVSEGPSELPQCGPQNKRSQWATYIAEQPYYDTVKLTNAPRITLAPSTSPSSNKHDFRYVVFPYKYDEVISTPLGSNKTVAETIALMRAAYQLGIW